MNSKRSRLWHTQANSQPVSLRCLADWMTVQPVLADECKLDCNEWAQQILLVLSSTVTEGQLLQELAGVTGLAGGYLSHLLIAGVLLCSLPLLVLTSRDCSPKSWGEDDTTGF